MSWRNINVTQDYLDERVARWKNVGYDFPKQKWIIFCEILLKEGYILSLYEAKSTFSKYITVWRKGSARQFKVRFSNHAPRLDREMNGDCDFFVGVTNLGVTNTDMALEAVRGFFGKT